MGAKICLILGILLISNVVFAPTEVMARAMLRELPNAEEHKSDVDARTPYNPLRPGVAIPGVPRGHPYTRPGTPYIPRPPPPGP